MRRRRLVVAAAALVALSSIPVAGPVQADPLPDAYTQIVSHQVPIQPDGRPTYGPFGWYRYYTGPNGLEIRFSNEGTWNVLQGIFAAETMGVGATSKALSAIVGSVLTINPNAVRIAMSAAALGSSFADDAIHRALLNGKCLGVTVPDAGVTTFLNRGLWLMGGQFYQAFNGPYYNDIRVWFENCTPASVGPLSDRIPTVSLPFFGHVLSAQQINYSADRTILHSSDGSLWVMAGGAKFYFGSMSEFYGLGYSTAGMVEVSTAILNAIPNTPRNGTILRGGGGQLYVVTGNAKFQFGSMAEYYNQGYANNQWINVPQWPLDQLGDVPGNKPVDGTIIQHPDGRLYIVVGGVKFQFGTMDEYHSLGYADAQIVRVSAAPINGLAAASTATPPSNGTILRGGGGQIYTVAGGAKFHFETVAEFHNQGYVDGSWHNVPQGPLDQIGDAPGHVPGNGTTVLRPDGALFVIAGGVRWYFGSMAEFSSEGYTTFTLVSQSALDGIYGADAGHLPSDETLLQGTDASVWVMQQGQRRQFGSMEQFNGLGYQQSDIVRVPNAVLAGIPSGGYLS